VSRGPEIFRLRSKPENGSATFAAPVRGAEEYTRRHPIRPKSTEQTARRTPAFPANGYARYGFDLISLPLYAVGELGRLLDALRTERTGE